MLYILHNVELGMKMLTDLSPV